MNDEPRPADPATNDEPRPEGPATNAPRIPDRLAGLLADVQARLAANQGRLDRLAARLWAQGPAPGADPEPESGAPDYAETAQRARRIITLAELGATTRAPATTTSDRAEKLDLPLVVAEQAAEILSPDPAAVADPLAGIDGDWFDTVLDRFPHLDAATVDHLVDQGGRTADGILNQLRGYRGESLVDALLGGDDLPHPPGLQGHHLADTTNQPGHDLVLDTDHGPLAANVKITDDPRLITDHLAAHPDVPVVYTTSDAAAHVDPDVAHVVGPGDAWPTDPGPVVVDIGHTSTELTDSTLAAVTDHAGDGIGHAIGHLLDDPLDALGDAAGFAVDHLPVMALGWIGVTTAIDVARGRLDSNAALEAARRRAVDTVAAAGAGDLVAGLTGSPLLSIPTALATRRLTVHLRRRSASYRRTIRVADSFARRVDALRPRPAPAV